MSEIKTSFCRSCTAFCPIQVTIENGRVIKVSGDNDAPLFEGYSCPKGRALPDQHNDPTRLLHSLKKYESGKFEKIKGETALAEITQKIESLVDEYGPNAVAMYWGTAGAGDPAGGILAGSWFSALGSSMSFSVGMIDKPGNYLGPILHGNWMAGPPTFESADTWMLIGANPVISRCGGISTINPAKQLKEGVKRGVKLVVVDPRKTETARRAHIHIQSRPGEDPSLLAGMIHIIIKERLYNQAFVNEYTQGFTELKRHVSAYTPEYVAVRAGVSAQQIIDAARVFANGKRGGIFCGTGPSFSTHSLLTNYLSLCMNTLCGYWLRAGDPVAKSNVLLPAYQAKAQPVPPRSPIVEDGIKFRSYGLRQTVVGLPTAAMADEILLEGDGQIKALICLAGNPMMALPDQKKTFEAMKKLDLLVVFDVEMTATAELADYVIASKLALECPSTTHLIEWFRYLSPTRGLEKPWAQYTSAVIKPPEGADIMDQGEFFFKMAQRMNMKLRVTNENGETFSLDMSRVPTSDEIIEMQCSGSRISLAEVKRYPHGNVFPGRQEFVQPADSDCNDKLELGDARMMQELLDIFEEDYNQLHRSPEYPFLLISRRMNNVMNSTGRSNPKLSSKKPYNPAFMHPDDLQRLQLTQGDVVLLSSRQDSAKAVVESDATVRPGIVSIAHCFGLNPDKDENPLLQGTNTSKLVDMKEFDPISGIPRMGAIPVSVRSCREW